MSNKQACAQIQTRDLLSHAVWSLLGDTFSRFQLKIYFWLLNPGNEPNSMNYKNVISEGFASNKYWLLRDALNQKQRMQFSNQTSYIELNVVARSCIFQKKVFKRFLELFHKNWCNVAAVSVVVVGVVVVHVVVVVVVILNVVVVDKKSESMKVNQENCLQVLGACEARNSSISISFKTDTLPIL